MRKVLVIAKREYLAAVKTKAFVIGLLIMPLMMGGSLVMQWLLKDFRDKEEKRFAVIDRTGGRLNPVLEQAVGRYNDTADARGLPPFKLQAVPLKEDTPGEVDRLRAELSEKVRKGELFGILEIGKDVFEPALPGEVDPRYGLRYQTNRPTHQEFPHLAETAVTEAVQQQRFQDLTQNTDTKALQKILRTVPLLTKGLSKRNAATGEVEDASRESQIAPIAVPLGLLMLMFMVIMMGATPSMQGVVEEKMQRIAEVLLGSVQPFQLMLGKLLGMTAISLTITAVYLGGAYWAAHHYGFAEFVPGALLVWFIVFQSLATLMYGSLFIAIGAACNDMKETQNLLWPVMLLACLPMIVVGNVFQEPNSTVATGLSFFPFATPMVMIARQAVPPGIPWWQPLAGAALVLATTLLCVYAAGRIFRVGLLMQGKGGRLSDIVRWVFKG
jgi:ABC-2 type transport system permease protein